MTVAELLEKVAADADTLMFADVIATIEQHYQYTPTRFVNGLGTDAVTNEAGSNEGSCKVFAFASLHDLNKHDTLNLFAEHFRKVLATPTEKDHANIRMFMRDGWPGIEFDGDALTARD